jgi:hypothetical protein
MNDLDDLTKFTISNDDAWNWFLDWSAKRWPGAGSVLNNPLFRLVAFGVIKHLIGSDPTRAKAIRQFMSDVKVDPALAAVKSDINKVKQDLINPAETLR